MEERKSVQSGEAGYVLQSCRRQRAVEDKLQQKTPKAKRTDVLA